jgi:hypothetical protein
MAGHEAARATLELNVVCKSLLPEAYEFGIGKQVDWQIGPELDDPDSQFASASQNREGIHAVAVFGAGETDGPHQGVGANA